MSELMLQVVIVVALVIAMLWKLASLTVQPEPGSPEVQPQAASKLWKSVRTAFEPVFEMLVFVNALLAALAAFRDHLAKAPEAPPVPLATGAAAVQPPAEPQLKKEEPSFTCGICLEKSKVEGSLTLSCDHRFCSECMASYVKGKVCSSAVRDQQLCCPVPSCAAPLTALEVQGALSFLEDGESLNQEYLAKTLEAAAVKDKSYGRCPHVGCDYMYLRTSGPMHFDCPRCQNSFCLECSAAGEGCPVGPAHPGRTCQQQLEHLKSDAAARRKFEEWRERNSRADELTNKLLQQSPDTRACPECGTFGFKSSDDCDHMRCMDCGFNFCFCCGVNLFLCRRFDTVRAEGCRRR